MDFVSFCGYLFLIYIVLKVGWATWEVFYPFILAKILGHNVKDLRAYCGANWAVITGATDGIGKAYAKQLAKKGFSIVLIGRNPEKLADTEKEIRDALEEAGGEAVDIKTVQFDFKETSLDSYNEMRQKLNDLDIGILVNNVGMSFAYPDVFHQIPGGDETALNVISVNSISVTMLTRFLLPQMLERKKGVVVNISSAAAKIPLPYVGIYSASKIFVDYLTQTLQSEYAGSGVFFQVVSPMFVATKMSMIRRTSFTIPSAESYVKEALDTIGLQQCTMGCLAHAMQGAVAGFIPTCIQTYVGTKFLKDTKAKALRRLEKEQ